MTCKDCVYAVQPTTTMRCYNHGIFMGDNAVVCNEFKVKPQTNYDRIISKTPEEMAEFLQKIRGGCMALTTKSDSCNFYTDDLNTDCKACWLEWLQQDAEQ